MRLQWSNEETLASRLLQTSAEDIKMFMVTKRNKLIIRTYL